MKKTIRLTESDLVHIVNRIIKEQDANKPDPVSNEGGNDSDYWGSIIKPKLSSNGWKEVADNRKGVYKCGYYMFKGNHENGPNIWLDCGNDPSRGAWNITVYTKGNQGVKKFGAGADEARKAVAYALTLK
jgi:hypothetical protein